MTILSGKVMIHDQPIHHPTCRRFSHHFPTIFPPCSPPWAPAIPTLQNVSVLRLLGNLHFAAEATHRAMAIGIDRAGRWWETLPIFMVYVKKYGYICRNSEKIDGSAAPWAKSTRLVLQWTRNQGVSQPFAHVEVNDWPGPFFEGRERWAAKAFLEEPTWNVRSVLYACFRKILIVRVRVVQIPKRHMSCFCLCSIVFPVLSIPSPGARPETRSPVYRTCIDYSTVFQSET